MVTSVVSNVEDGTRISDGQLGTRYGSAPCNQHGTMTVFGFAKGIVDPRKNSYLLISEKTRDSKCKPSTSNFVTSVILTTMSSMPTLCNILPEKNAPLFSVPKKP